MLDILSRTRLTKNCSIAGLTLADDLTPGVGRITGRGFSE